MITTPLDEFPIRFCPFQGGGVIRGCDSDSAHKEDGGFGKSLTAAFHRRMLRSAFALFRVVEKIVGVEIRPAGQCYLCVPRGTSAPKALAAVVCSL